MQYLKTLLTYFGATSESLGWLYSVPVTTVRNALAGRTYLPMRPSRVEMMLMQALSQAQAREDLPTPQEAEARALYEEAEYQCHTLRHKLYRAEEALAKLREQRRRDRAGYAASMQVLTHQTELPEAERQWLWLHQQQLAGQLASKTSRLALTRLEAKVATLRAQLTHWEAVLAEAAFYRSDRDVRDEDPGRIDGDRHAGYTRRIETPTQKASDGFVSRSDGDRQREDPGLRGAVRIKPNAQKASDRFVSRSDGDRQREDPRRTVAWPLPNNPRSLYLNPTINTLRDEETMLAGAAVPDAGAGLGPGRAHLRRADAGIRPQHDRPRAPQ